LLDIGTVGLGKAGRKADLPGLEPRPLEVAGPVERRELACCEGAHALDDRLDHIGLGRGKALVAGELGDAGIDADRKQLVGGGGHEGRHERSFTWLWATGEYTAPR
jgi:hypothetical protein